MSRVDYDVRPCRAPMFQLLPRMAILVPDRRKVEDAAVKKAVYLVAVKQVHTAKHVNRFCEYSFRLR